MDQKIIAGVDEAGRGPLAGPVVAAAVILNPDFPIEGLRDSKKISEKKRTVLAARIRAHALAVGVGVVHEQDIDRTNILKATFAAMREAVRQMNHRVDGVRVDGKFTIPELNVDQTAIVGGDDLHPEISAASIIAKTTRDAMMRSYHILFPNYGFFSHKGYGSVGHMEALRKHGRSPIHRRSFRPLDSTPNLEYLYRHKPEHYGRMGEIIAGMHLVRHGYHLKAYSYHAGRSGEIDLIAEKNDRLVFVEVKSSGTLEDDTLLERVTEEKQTQIAHIAEQYLQENDLADCDVQFDIITINFAGDKPEINHYEDAFLPI